MDWTRAQVLLGVLALSAVSLTVYMLGGEVVRAGIVVAMSLAVTATGMRRVGRVHGHARRVYGFMLAGFIVLNAAVSLRLTTVVLGMEESSIRGAWQALLGISYLLILTAALLMIGRSAKQDLGEILDASTLAVAAASALWQSLIAPAMERVDATYLQRGYLFLVVIALSGSVGAVIGLKLNGGMPQAARPVYGYMTVALLFTVAGNVAGATLADPVTDAAPWWAGAMWVLAYSAAWGAITHPAGPDAFAVGRPHPSRLTSRRILVLGIALIASPAIAIARDLSGGFVGWPTSAAATTALVLMVLARVSQLAGAHRAAESQLRVLADHDTLTGLPNRRAVERHLESLLDRVARSTAAGATVWFIDLDDFKPINDTRGHAIGDELLTAVAHRLAGLVREDRGDLVGRLGGDEFIVVVEGDPQATATTLTARIRSAFDDDFTLSDGPAQVSASIGLDTASPHDPHTLDDMLTHADHEMYAEKHARRLDPTD
ncbi:GGDEF domain-containing protein [Demequina sp. NBRC 110054]|uniref:GGDEF domain-containing protein n=1 Tax=Demequina sp. NBRC 110054 TaxID=1570343 RepID=UPI001356411D|nr:GGDEF domain-containing protein [Demequina sp. NBRC 110054]